MKRSLLLGTAVLLGGCYVEPQPRYYQTGSYQAGGYYQNSSYTEISVGEPQPIYYEAPPPPPPRYEARPAAPFYGAVWVDGWWDWRGGTWVWVNGYWVAPRDGCNYVGPRYDYNGGRVVVVRPHWQPAVGGNYPVAPPAYPSTPTYPGSRPYYPTTVPPPPPAASH